MHCSLRAPLAFLSLFATGCSLLGGGDRPASVESGAAPGETPVAETPVGWRAIVRPADRDRIARWREAWTLALAKARAAGFGARLDAEGRLLAPDAALADPAPPPGDYRCRVIKLGSQGEGGLDHVAYPPFRCRIATEESRLRLTKIDGSQRPDGFLYPEDGGRMIFLGAMALGDEARALEYGRDPDRDMIGAFEQVGPQRWRLALPFPRWESQLDVMELVPAR